MSAGITAAVMLFASPAAVADDVDTRLNRLEAQLHICTSEHGYSPGTSRSLAPNEIGPGEEGWRECAYEGIRRIMVPGSAVPEAYETLIALDRVMTREIAAGERTRGEREERIDGMVNDVLARDRAAGQADGSKTDLVKERDELMRRQAELQKMRRIQSMTR